MSWKHWACCATAALALVAASPERTELRFRWPETAKAKVRYTVERSRVQQNGATSSTKGTSGYDLLVRHRGDQLIVERVLSKTPRDPGPTRPDGTPLPGVEPLQTLIDDAAERIPILVVDAGGELVSVEGTEPIRAELEKILASSSLSLTAQETVRSIFTDKALASIAKQQWSVWVGIWKGQVLETGRPYTQKRRGQFPGTRYDVGLVVETRLAGYVPCHPPAKDRRCVELHLESRADPEDVARTIERLNLSATTGIRDLKLEQSFTVVAEPGTLLPHRCTRSLVSEIEHAPGSGGAPRSQKLLETWEFDYAP
ncbi:MAG TPA: hypothetical protein VFS60_15480 [Thermoanaerobaculia bacterium]|nr:hypothetical protein [Thermoanaerobaculia bacterium]